MRMQLAAVHSSTWLQTFTMVTCIICLPADIVLLPAETTPFVAYTQYSRSAGAAAAAAIAAAFLTSTGIVSQVPAVAATESSAAGCSSLMHHSKPSAVLACTKPRLQAQPAPAASSSAPGGALQSIGVHAVNLPLTESYFPAKPYMHVQPAAASAAAEKNGLGALDTTLLSQALPLAKQ
jgi:hypothetical protein